MWEMRLATEDGVLILREQHGRWLEAGHTLQGQNVWVIAHRPGAPEVLYAGTYGEGLFRSRDGGQNWQPVGQDVPMQWVRSIAFVSEDPQTVYVGAEPANVLGSTDGGDTWANLGIRSLPGADEWYLPYSPRGGAVRTLALHLEEPALLYGGVEQGGVIKSVNGGTTWTISRKHEGNNGGIHPDIHHLALHPHDPQMLFAATGGGMYRTYDRGETWEHLIRDYTRAVVIHPQHPNLVLCAPSLRVSHDGRIMASEDGGTSWVLAARGLTVPMKDMVESFYMHPERPDEVWAVRSNGEVLHSAWEELHWLPLEPGVTAVKAIEIVSA